jgi:tRNA(Leu) C34 or U34 (ribose-2'-O)-methylase TrmL
MSRLELYVVVETPTRTKNIGTIIRCAVAFGATAVCIYGYSTFSTHGAHKSQKYMKILHFYYLKDCVLFLKQRECSIYSMSPTMNHRNDSVPIEKFDFNKRSAAFIVSSGREHDLLVTPEQASNSDKILHVTVPVAEFDHALHYNAKISICLETYARHALFNARLFYAEKYVIDDTVDAGSVDLDKAYAEFNLGISNSMNFANAFDESYDDNLCGLFGDASL